MNVSDVEIARAILNKSGYSETKDLEEVSAKLFYRLVFLQQAGLEMSSVCVYSG